MVNHNMQNKKMIESTMRPWLPVLSILFCAAMFITGCGGGGTGKAIATQSAEGKLIEGLYSCNTTKMVDSATGVEYGFVEHGKTTLLSGNVPFYATLNMRKRGNYRYFIGALNTSSGGNYIFGSGEGSLNGLVYTATDTQGDSMTFNFRFVPNAEAGVDDVYTTGEVMIKGATVQGSSKKADLKLSIDCQHTWNLALMEM